jgi:hypothetical protein
MAGELKPVKAEALLGEVEGPKVYVSPSRGEVSQRPREDAVAVPVTTWWGEGTPSSLFSIAEVRKKIAREAAEMAVYFPDFKLYEKDGELLWLGSIAGIGEIRITYPRTYPSQKFLVQALDLEESFNEELKQLIWRYKGITPAGSIIVTMRLFLLKRFSRK